MPNYRTFDYDDLKKVEFFFNKSQGKNKQTICENIITYDIETSNGFRLDNGDIVGFDMKKYDSDEDYRNMIDNAEPQSLLYVWQCSVESKNGDIYTFLGRTWEDYIDFMNALTLEIRRAEIFGGTGIKALSNEYMTAMASHRKAKMYCFIHNFGFEFQHLLNVFKDEFLSKRGTKMDRVFAREARKPMKANICYNGVRVEFHDSLVLVQKSLKQWGKDDNLTVQKLEEPKDYYLPIRTPETPLTDEELDYSENDVVTMVYGIQKYREKYGCLEKIPLTQTGEVRLKCREKVSLVNMDWASLCVVNTKSYTLEFYEKLVRLFSGGWTHANSSWTNMLLRNIRCFDFASSYPACMTMRTFPIGTFQTANVKDFHKYEKQDLHSPTLKYHWFAKIKVSNVETKLSNTFWSLSKSIDIEDPEIDNGRIRKAKTFSMFITDLDWDVFKKAYSFDTPVIEELYVSESGYLPKELILTILEYYKYKTSLKDVEGSESKYAESKQFVNSIYGCMVTRDFCDSVKFVEESEDNDKPWIKTPITASEFEDKRDKTSPEKTFGCFQLGCWVTAWARHNLWDAILAEYKLADGSVVKFDKKVVYCDTDSCKGMFNDKDLEWFDDYNKNIAAIQEMVAAIVGFDLELYCPKTPDGTPKRLGIFAEEETCLEFKTLGAKRYVDLVYNKKKGENEIQATIAGLPKKNAAAKLKCVSAFRNELVWNTEESGKLMACYNDNQTRGVWIDRDGNRYDPYKNSFYPQYGLCLKPTTFNLKISPEYEELLIMVHYGRHSIECVDFIADVPDMFL